jgi:hypothetical protein
VTGVQGLPGLELVPASRVAAAGAEWALARRADGDRLVVAAPVAAARLLDELEGETTARDGGVVLVGPAGPRNAAALRRHVPGLRPVPLGLRPSAGLGDRLGLATPGHVRAIRAAGGGLAPVFAQQSVREMARTGRTPREVLDDATWGMFAEGWRGEAGADADHLKTAADVAAGLGAGFTLFTLDPGEHVDAGADTADAAALRARAAGLPWAELEDTAAALRGRYLDRSFAAEHLALRFDEEVLLRAAVKYGRAVAHVARLWRHLAAAAGDRRVEVEVSVDETETPTTPAEHLFVARELTRLGVGFVSLAPRFVGRFEKGVDYLGDLAALERDLAAHAAIARALGPYKLSLHSGSDKLSVYPLAARATRGLVHLKTAGTSYLEALRTVAVLDPPLFRAIYAFARERYETDRASYHVSAELGRAPPPAGVPAAALPALLEHFDARQILHVTFGSVLAARAGDGRPRFKDALLGRLRQGAEAYARNLEAHLGRHLRPFVEARA